MNAGENRIGGRWGSAWDSAGNLISEMVEVVAAVELGRINVPLVGTMRDGHKIGPESREGTMRVQKVDSDWELKVYDLLSQGTQKRRDARDGKVAKFNPEFSIILKLDDPDALGIEKWQLEGVRIWRLPLGFNINDELVEREYPITWETERPLAAFRRKPGTGEAQAEYVIGNHD